MTGLALAATSCGSSIDSPFAQNLSSRDWTPEQESPAEKEYCITTSTFETATISVSGQAGYLYRDTVLEPGSEGLGDVSTTARPIRHAQYEVINGAGERLQCGETDENGAFSFVAPMQERTLSLRIFSRSNNEFNRASVFVAPETNELHFLEYSFVASADRSNVTIAAEGDDTVLGGAFFILDQIHIAFDRLNELLPALLPGSASIDDIPKADIYWEAGFNPGVYIGTGALSFFSSPQQKIFILGGDNGNVNFSDTDHFDPSIILHEYFHFLENSTIGSTSSPGGSHSGNEVLDPRLAWSEGAAQFFQAAITGNPSVIDTRGNPDGITGLLVKFGLENDINDEATVIGEADYREFAIARFLWDLIDDDTIDDDEDAPEDAFDLLSDGFPSIWQAFSNRGLATGLNSNDAEFISMGLFLEAMNLNGAIPINDEALDDDPFDLGWKLLLNNERFTFPEPDANNSFRGAYGIPTDYIGTGTTTFTLPAPFSAPTADIETTNPIRNINFHTIILANTQTLTLTRETGSGALEFYVYDTDYIGLSDYINEGDESTPVTLQAGVYLVAVVVRSVSSQNDFTYNFDGFQIGEL